VSPPPTVTVAGGEWRPAEQRDGDRLGERWRRAAGGVRQDGGGLGLA
jgi:hypothetical protein